MKPDQLDGKNTEMLALLYSHLEVHPDLLPDDAECIRRSTAIYLEAALCAEHDLRSGIANMALAADITATSVSSGEEGWKQVEAEGLWPAPEAENRDKQLRAVFQRATANLKPNLLKVFERHPTQGRTFLEREKQIAEATEKAQRTPSALLGTPDGHDLIVLSQEVAAYALKRSTDLMQGIQMLRRKLMALELRQRRNEEGEKPAKAAA